MTVAFRFTLKTLTDKYQRAKKVATSETNRTWIVKYKISLTGKRKRRGEESKIFG